MDGQSVLSSAIDTTFNQGCRNVSAHVQSMTAMTGRKAIIVAIETTGKACMDELIPAIGPTSKGADSFFGKAGTKQTGTKLCEFICDTLMPYIDENYNVYPDRLHKEALPAVGQIIQHKRLLTALPLQ